MNRFATWALACPLFLLVLQTSSPSAYSMPPLSLAERQSRIQDLIWNLSANPAWPQTLQMNLELVYRYSHPEGSLEIVNAYPMGAKRKLVKRNATFSSHPFPDYFIVGDGALRGRLMLVDKRPGSRLSRVLDELVSQILDLYGFSATGQLLDTTLTEFLSLQVQDYLSYPQSGALYDPSPGITTAVEASAHQATLSLKGQAPGSFSASIPQYRHPVRAFEIALREGSGICIDMALLTSFVLERFGVPHRVVFGANVSKSADGSSGGHTWIELATGEVLDPTWKFRKAPDHQHLHPDHSDWFYVNQQFRFGYPTVPIVPLSQ